MPIYLHKYLSIYLSIFLYSIYLYNYLSKFLLYLSIHLIYQSMYFPLSLSISFAVKDLITADYVHDQELLVHCLYNIQGAHEVFFYFTIHCYPSLAFLSLLQGIIKVCTATLCRRPFLVSITANCWQGKFLLNILYIWTHNYFPGKSSSSKVLLSASWTFLVCHG